MSNEEVLIVVSKLKNYIKDSSEMNTAGNVAPALSGIIRALCDQAIQNAKSDGRKTVMDRDFSFSTGGSSPAA
jgi:histone H3/H4